MINRKKERLWKYGLPATADVIKVGKTGINEGDDAFARPVLEVLLCIKDEQFRDVKVWVRQAFDADAFPEVGNQAKILIDPDNTSSATILSIFKN